MINEVITIFADPHLDNNSDKLYETAKSSVSNFERDFEPTRKNLKSYFIIFTKLHVCLLAQGLDIDYYFKQITGISSFVDSLFAVLAPKLTYAVALPHFNLEISRNSYTVYYMLFICMILLDQHKKFQNYDHLFNLLTELLYMVHKNAMYFGIIKTLD